MLRLRRVVPGLLQQSGHALGVVDVHICSRRFSIKYFMNVGLVLSCSWGFGAILRFLAFIGDFRFRFRLSPRVVEQFPGARSAFWPRRRAHHEGDLFHPIFIGQSIAVTVRRPNLFLDQKWLRPHAAISGDG